MTKEMEFNIVKIIILSIIAIYNIITCSVLLTIRKEINKEYNYDVNKDGVVDSKDYVLIKNYIMEEVE